MNDFIYTGSWFDNLYRTKLDGRYPTMKAALNLLEQLTPVPSIIVETGVARMEDDWGAGMSTLLFAEYCDNQNGYLYSVDNSEENCRFATNLTSKFTKVTIICEDSVKYLKGFEISIDLLYLDSMDYPYGDLLNLYGGREELSEAIRILSEMPQDEVLRLHGDLILPAQEHCLAELKAGLPLMTDKGVILLDDNNLPGGGKPRLAKEWLAKKGWTCVMDYQQSLWIKR